MGQVQTTEEASISTVDAEAAVRSTTREGNAGAAATDAPAVRKAPSSKSTVLANPFALEQLCWEEADERRKSALAIPVEQGDFAATEALTKLVSSQLGEVVETLPEASTPQNQPHKRGSERPGKSRSRNRNAKSAKKSPASKASSTSASAQPNPAVQSARQGKVAIGASNGLYPKYKAGGAKDTPPSAVGIDQGRTRSRAERQPERQRNRSAGGSGAKSPRTLAKPASRAPTPQTAPLLPADAQLVAVRGRRPREHDVAETAAFESTVVTTGCLRAGALMCVLGLLGCFVAVTALLAFSAVRVLGHRGRIIHDFDNWTLYQFKMARASAASTTGSASSTAASLPTRNYAVVTLDGVNGTVGDVK